MESDVLEDFLTESTEHLERMEQDLLALEAAELAGPQVLEELLNRLFRGVHSIKGAAGFLELEKVVELTHCMENIFGELRQKKNVPEAGCVDALLSAGDVLRRMLARPGSLHEVDSAPVLSALSAFVVLPEKSGMCLGSASPKSAILKHESCHLYRLDFPVGGKQQVLEALEGIAQIGRSDETSVHVSSVLEPELLEAALTGLTATVKTIDVAEFSGADVRISKPQKPEAPAVRTTAPENNSPEGAAEKGANPTIRIDLALLERLMSLAGELVLVRNRHSRWFAHGAQQDETGREITQRLDTVTRELQTSIMKTRMQPLERVLSKLPRLVREVSRQLGKEINLSITGSEIEVDRAILESLADPLTHLLRNSCDHGIESPERRKSSGKPLTGEVRVRASHENGCIIIEVADDGGGIDADKIAAKSVEKGLITAQEAQGLDTRGKLELIMRAGFSTAESVSSISGRGVGMDVVKSAVEKLGGSIEIDSRFGEGSCFFLRLPLTLAIIQSLLVSSGGRRYVIPRMNLEEVLNLVGAEVCEKVRVVNGQEVLDYHHSYLQLVRLSEVFATPLRPDATQRESLARKKQRENAALFKSGRIPTMDVVVVRVGERKIGLVVDQTLEMEEIVVKPLHPAHKELGIFLGATVLGDGLVALILDVEGIARHALEKIHYTLGKQSARPDEFAARSDDAQRMLSFECGKGERFAIGLSFLRRIHSIRRDELESIGGRLFARVNDKPVLLARMEQALQVSPCAMLEELYLIMPRFGSRGCGILASGICGIREIKADFSESPLADSALMGSAVLDGVTTLFPDIYQVCEAAEYPAASTKTPAPRSGQRGGWTPHSGLAKRILLAEDAPFFRQLICTYLRRENIRVDTANNGAEALKLLETNEYDLLLSDVEMPVMDGRELARRVKSSGNPTGMPVIALTSLDNEQDRAECLRAGFDEYMIKINREQLLAALGKFL